VLAGSSFSCHTISLRQEAVLSTAIHAIFVTAFCLGAGAIAAMPAEAASTAQDSTALPAPSHSLPANEAALPQSGEPAALDTQELAGVAAGEAAAVMVVTTQNLDATSTGNTINADNVQSGGVNFSGNALNGFNGIGNFVINTGNNNTLQGSLSVTVVTAGQ
jgi:hypothetical protein